MNKEKGRIVNLIIDIACIVICVVLLFVAISNLASKGKGYVAYFGTISMGIETDSMWPYAKNTDGTYATTITEGAVLYEKDNAQGYLPSFKSGDLLIADELNDEERQQLKVGDVITYRVTGIEEDKVSLVCHRIVDLVKEDNVITRVVTRGDGEGSTASSKTIFVSSVVGKVETIRSGAGAFNVWVKTSGGFFVCVVLPSILIVGYFLVMLILAFSKRDTAKAVEDKQALEEKLRVELEAKLRAEMGLNAQPDSKPEEETESNKPE